MGTHGVCGPIQRIIHGLERGRDKETETQRHGESIPRRRQADIAAGGTRRRERDGETETPVDRHSPPPPHGPA